MPAIASSQTRYNKHPLGAHEIERVNASLPPRSYRKVCSGAGLLALPPCLKGAREDKIYLQ